jgi:hypothetical protein
MTPESWNCPLLANGSLTHVSVETDKTQNNRGTVRHGDIFGSSRSYKRVPRDSDPRKTALARASNIYKRQTRPLVREGTPQKQDRSFQIEIYIWS